MPATVPILSLLSLLGAISIDDSPENEPLADLLRPKGEIPWIGEERGRFVRNGISKFESISRFKDGSIHSVRYLLSMGDGSPIGAMQIVVSDRTAPKIANIYVRPRARRHGVATSLFHRAKKDFPTLQHSEHLTIEGEAWKTALKKSEPRDPWRVSFLAGRASYGPIDIEFTRAADAAEAATIARPEFERAFEGYPEDAARYQTAIVTQDYDGYKLTLDPSTGTWKSKD